MNKKMNKKQGNPISRREFVTHTAAGTAGMVIAPLTGLFAGNAEKSNWPADASKFQFHMIGHAHIDPVWLWPWTEGISIVHSTFQSALDRMNETPDFTFVASSAQFYHWVAQNDPEMLEAIKKRVDEGRWNIVGGWWVEPDVNIPGGEAMVRQGLYGQLTFQKLLGHRAKVGFNPDSFGHAGTLPQILKKQGLENYAFMRPGPHEKTNPASLFWWEGQDGTRVLTYRIPISYNETQAVRNRLEKILEQFPGEPMNDFMAFYGAGDHGGGATKINIQSIEELKTEKGAPKVFFSTIDGYFKKMWEDKSLKLPVVKDDLQHHAVGCYTAEMEIKKGNRQSEAALMLAEKMAAIGSVAWKARYPKDELTASWQRVLFLQFHDSLAGTSVPDHSNTAREGYGLALDTAKQAIAMAIQKLEWQIAAEDPDSQYMVVFNPHAWEWRGVIEYDFNWGTMHRSSRVDDEKGNPLAHQWTFGTTETGSRKTLLVDVVVPAMGYRQIRLRDGESPVVGNAVKAEGNLLENEFLQVRFSESGAISMIDRETGKAVFTGENGCRALIIDDPSDTWSHDIKTFADEIGAFGNATVTVIETGPLRAITRVVSRYGNSALIIDWILVSGSRNLEAKVTLDWHERLKMLKFSFPVDVELPVATYETPYGFIVREPNGNEEPGQRWIDVTGKRGAASYGLTVINDAKYGYCVAGNDMRISVARAAVYAHHNPRKLEMQPEHIWMDQGIHTFRMLLAPHNKSWKENGTVRMAEELVERPVVIYQGIHGGTLPKSGSFLSVDAPNIVMPAIKLAENNDDLVVRCVETSGLQTAATMKLNFINREWKAIFQPNEIKTLRINRNFGEITEVNLLEE